jgi:hypothetical protein
MGLLWMLFHTKVYGNDDAALLSTFGFGTVGFFVSLVTMSFIPFVLMHFITNFMLALKKYGLMSNDGIGVAVVFAELIFIAVFFLLYRNEKAKSKVRRFAKENCVVNQAGVSHCYVRIFCCPIPLMNESLVCGDC